MRRYLLTCETVDDDDDFAIEKIIRRLAQMPHRVMLRIVIQWDQKRRCMKKPGEYRKTFQELSKHASIMISCVDSDAAMNLTEESYKRNYQDCIDVLGSHCEVVETGNEINCSNWLEDENREKPHSHPPDEVVRMVKSALEVCAQANDRRHLHLRTAITYYLGGDEEPPHTLHDWLVEHAQKMPSDHALISHYPNSTDRQHVISSDEIVRRFKEFSDKVPAASIGWGEYGTEGEYPNVMGEETIIRRFEGDFWKTLSAIPKFDGFGGYWDWQRHERTDRVFQELWQ